MPITKRTLDYILLSALALITLFIISLILYFTLYGRQPLIWNHPPKTLQNSYSPGDILIYEADYCKNTNSSFTALRSWRDGIVYTVPSTKAAGRQANGCYVSHHPIQVPKLPPGIYVLDIVLIYDVGPFLKREVRTSTNSFKITK